ncbi:hypothetical protein NPIL_81441 [Nephila pilipes]|uniref:Uncharacterized protein n=1 Tax=Nephila pilipes TaxID=299642 RepID=A0A8X6MXC5_NEPPI|nr:hypothetical protein NPIL_81441 [Nephila pilipes]
MYQNKKATHYEELERGCVLSKTPSEAGLTFGLVRNFRRMDSYPWVRRARSIPTPFLHVDFCALSFHGKATCDERPGKS